ncbi:long-chain-fatty-acid--CoA ligase [Streptomyces sp. NPDC001595]|uniref:long-chain-fatty-acid--CoA ligase n=1 Tax=Streptomyces sp. NPDC001532 TaxID=3154520 RepID=UPI00331F2DD5
MATIAENLTETARRHPDRPALRFGSVVLTYAEVDAAASEVARALLAQGLEPGDRVGVMLPNVPAFVAYYYGVLRAGGVVVPMNPLLRAREIEHCLADSGARRLFVSEAAAPEAAKGAETAGATVTPVGPGLPAADDTAGPVTAERRDDDLAVILYTSGTTGRPKGAALTHRNLGRNTEVLADSVLALGPEDVVMGCLPLFHAFGQTCGMNAAVRQGACLVLVPRFDPAEVLDLLDTLRVTVFEGVPTMYNALLHQPASATREAAALRLCVSGGAALPTEVLHGFEQRFGCAVAEGYGLSETSPVVTFNHLDRPRKPGSIGTPIAGVEVRLIDGDGYDVPEGEIGEIAVRGHNVMAGYWNRPDATAEAIPDDGWFRTGDLARRDDDGYYFVVDRKKDMIIRGGYNVYPREIEEVLYEHPEVVEAAVVGVPHDSLGEEVAAAVVLTPDARTTADELRAYVKERVAPYKYPRTVHLLPALPKGPTGKILKREIQLV